MNPSDLQDAWTRMLDGEVLSVEELAALNEALESNGGQWMSDDFTTDQLLRSLHAVDPQEAIRPDETADFVRRVQHRIAQHHQVDPPPVVLAPPVVASIPDAPQQKSSTPTWAMAATAASILLVAALSVAIYVNRDSTGDHTRTAQQPQPTKQPTGSIAQMPERDSEEPTREPLDPAPDPTPESLAHQPSTTPSAPVDEPANQVAVDVPEAAVDPMPRVEPVLPLDPAVPDTPALATSAIAKLVHSKDAVWREGYVPAAELASGPVLLASGEASLRLKKGTELTLTGPVELELIDDNQVQLTTGLIHANVPQEAIGFQVQTPGGRIVDLGTRFTVERQTDEGLTFVHVTEGKVEAIQPPLNPRGRERKTRLTAGRTKWLPDDGGQAFDWRLVIEFGDAAIKPEHLAINGEAFDARNNVDQQNAMKRLAESFEAAQTQRELVARGERFSGILIINDVPQVLKSTDQMAQVQTQVLQRVAARWKQFPQILTPEDIFDQIQQRMRAATIGIQP